MTTAMRRLLYLVPGLCLAILAGIGVWQYTGALPIPNPEDGGLRASAYTNPYFDLSYPLPSGWIEDVAGPGPSESGYYVLGTFVPEGRLSGTVMIAAQDMFFTGKSPSTAPEMVADFHRSLSEIDGMTVDESPSQTTIGGRLFHRVDFNGVGLYRSTFAVEIRCHLVSFNFTSNDPERLASLVLTMNQLSSASQGGSSPPRCIKDYASGD